MISFIIGCVMLALCIALGFFFLNIGVGLLVLIVGSIGAGISALYNWLKNNWN